MLVLNLELTIKIRNFFIDRLAKKILIMKF